MGCRLDIPTGVWIQFWILGYAWLWFRYPDPTLLPEAEQSGVSIATRSDQPGICIRIWSWWDVHLMLELFSVCLSVSLLFSLSFSYILHAFVHVALGNELCFSILHSIAIMFNISTIIQYNNQQYRQKDTNTGSKKICKRWDSNPCNFRYQDFR